MQATQRLRALLQQLALALLALAIAGSTIAAPDKAPLKTSFSTDFTDIWWNKLKSGMGMQIVQTGNFIFVTIYVYGADGKATWFTGELTASAANTFTGNLYVSTGPYFGGPFDPAMVNTRPAGTMQFQALTPDSGLLSYSVDGVVVNEPVEREPLTLDDYNGTFAAVGTQTTSNCTNPANNGASTSTQIIQISQNGQFMAAVLQLPGGISCSLTGTYSQLGRSGRFDGTYICSSGDAGRFSLFEMNNHVRQFNARTAFESTNAGCQSLGRITGVIPD